MDVHWNAPAVVQNRNGLIFMNDDLDCVAVSGQGLVDRVIHHLIDQMMEPADGGIPDIHRRPAADRLHPLQNLDGRGIVIGFGRGLCGSFLSLGSWVLGLGFFHEIFPSLNKIFFTPGMSFWSAVKIFLFLKFIWKSQAEESTQTIRVPF